MEIICTRPHCPRPRNIMPDLDDKDRLGSIEQAYCTACRMPLILGGRYIPNRFLGKGGFGAAFLAFDRFHPRLRKCVVKQFQPSSELGTQAIEKAQGLFVQEAEVLADLGRENPSIPELYASFPLNVPNPLTEKKDRFFYLVQQYIDGETLEKKLETKNSPFSETEVRNILEDLLHILKNIHASGVIHRDIKPSNIIQDSNDKVYLIDFGSVKQVANIEGVSTRMFTPGYAPPEQEAGATVSQSSDLYALGATCVHLLTNRYPNELCNPITKIWNWQPYAPKVSDTLAEILNTMLQPHPGDRFQSAGEILSRLNVTTLPPSVPTPPIIPTPPNATQTNIQPQTLPTPPVLTPPQGPVLSAQPKTPLVKIITSAGLVGFMGAIISIGLSNLLPSIGVIIGLAIMTAAVISLNRRLIDRKDILIFIAISTFLMVVIPKLRGSVDLANILILAVFTGLAAILITVLFRLIYNLISRVI